MGNQGKLKKKQSRKTNVFLLIVYMKKVLILIAALGNHYRVAWASVVLNAVWIRFYTQN